MKNRHVVHSCGWREQSTAGGSGRQLDMWYIVVGRERNVLQEDSAANWTRGTQLPGFWEFNEVGFTR